MIPPWILDPGPGPPPDPVGTHNHEILASDPHHGLKSQGAVYAHRALARMEGGAAMEGLLSRYATPEEVMELPGRYEVSSPPVALPHL